MNTQPPTRDEFREAVFARDGKRCVVCHEPAVDAHHVCDRSLFPDGGYETDNGVSLCAKHHLDAEQTVLSCDYLRKLAGITNLVLPPQCEGETIDHWGNPILPNGLRMRGELFDNEAVQKALTAGGVLGMFTKYVKYPRTFHVPWSPGNATGDKKHMSLPQFPGKRVVVTTKMDGEPTTCTNDYIHARSVDSRNHPSRNWVRQFHANFAYFIPEGYRVCGENLFAKHSCHYHHLKSLFLVFNVWDSTNTALSWDETVEWAALLGLNTVEVLYDGIWDEEKIKGLWTPERNGDPMEGYVVRVADKIKYAEWTQLTAKWVRPHHVQTDEHWTRQAIVKNEVETDYADRP